MYDQLTGQLDITSYFLNLFGSLALSFCLIAVVAIATLGCFNAINKGLSESRALFLIWIVLFISQAVAGTVTIALNSMVQQTMFAPLLLVFPGLIISIVEILLHHKDAKLKSGYEEI